MGKIYFLLLFVLLIKLPATLVAHYDFNGNTNDAIYANNAIIYGSPQLTYDRFGNANSAYYFNGNGDYLRIANSAHINFSLTQNFSVSFWVKPDNTQPTTVTSNMMLEKWSGTEGYPFVIRYFNQTSSKNGQVYGARWNGSSQSSVTSSVTINDGFFHHIAFIKNGNNVSLYVDGILEGTSTDLTSGDTTNTSDLYIACRGGASPYFFAGVIDDVQIYNHGLTFSEIQQIVPEISNIWMGMICFLVVFLLKKRY